MDCQEKGSQREPKCDTSSMLSGPEIILTTDELSCLVRFWANQILEIKAEWLTGSVASWDRKSYLHANKRIGRIRSIGGDKLVEEAVEREVAAFREAVGPEDGRIFFGGTEEERKALGDRWAYETWAEPDVNEENAQI